MKNTGRGIRKVLSVLFALVIVGSCFACSAGAASFGDILADAINDSIKQTSDAINKSMDKATDSVINSMNQTSDSINRSIATANAQPSPEHPLTYTYKGTFYARDPYGRAVSISDRIIERVFIDFYISKEAYENGADPIYTDDTGTDEAGKGTFQYTDVFQATPPASLYFVIRPHVDVTFSPSSGTVYAQLDPQV